VSDFSTSAILFSTIGQSKVDDETLLKIQRLLKKEKNENRLNDAKLAPAWINKILIQGIK